MQCTLVASLNWWDVYLCLLVWFHFTSLCAVVYLFYLSYKLNFITNYESKTTETIFKSLCCYLPTFHSFDAYCSLFSGSIILCVNWECLALIKSWHLNKYMRVCECVSNEKKSFTFMKSCEIIHVTVLSSLTSSYFFIFICTWRSNLQLFAFVTE